MPNTKINYFIHNITPPKIHLLVTMILWAD